MKQFQQTLGDIQIQCSSPEEGAARIIYLLEPEKVISGLSDLVDSGRVAIVSVFGMDWDKDLTPWPAPNVRKKAADFGGGAESFMNILEQEIVPSVENKLAVDSMKFTSETRSLIGISLAGLFAVFCATKSNLFSGIGSVSGSFWYDGFADWFREQALTESVKNVYLSVGEQEKYSGNPRFSAIENRTEEVMNILAGKGINVFYELNPGGHIADGIPRIRKAIGYLNKQK